MGTRWVTYPLTCHIYNFIERIMLDFTQIKAHVGRHKTEYIVGSIVIAGITYIIMRSHTGIQRVPESSIPRVLDGPTKVTVTPFSLLSNRQTNNVINIIHKEGRGHPGYPVFDLDDKILYNTQGLAAKALNAWPSVVSGHLNGKLSDVNGHHLIRVPNAI